MNPILVMMVDPYDPLTGLLVPALSQRILGFAREHFNELDPEVFARLILSRLYAKDPNVGAAVLVESSTGKMVGHAVATIESDGVNKWVFISQAKADGNVGDAIQRAILLADDWGRSMGATKMVMSTPRSDAAWKRKYGFDTMRHLMIRPLGSPVAEGGDG